MVITTLQLQATRSNSEYKAWRKGSYVPHRGAAPIVDIDEGELTYVLVEAVSPAGDVVTLVRGFVKEEYPSHADVLDTAQEPLAHAGYTAIRCVGGGTLWHTKWSKTMFISGASRFGPANHRVTERLLREHWIGGYRIAILDEGALAEPVGSAIAQVADLSTYA